MPVQPDNAMGPAPSSHVHTPADWEAHRGQISSLYRRHTLAEVQQIMACKHGFHATQRMYRQRLSAWGQDKNIKRHEMQAVAVEAHRTLHRGRPPVFLVRGKVITYDAVQRYYRRRKMTVDEAIADPEPPRHSAAQSTGPLSSGSDSTGASPSTLSSAISTRSPTPPRVLAAPAVLAVPEHAIRKTIEYVLGSFDAQVWQSSVDNGQYLVGRSLGARSPCKLYDAMNNMHSQARLACDLFDQQRPDDAGIFLAASMMGIQSLVQAAWPPIPTYLPHTLHSIVVRQKPEVARAVLRQFARFVALFHGVEHPMFHFCTAIGSVEPSQLLDAVRALLAAVHDAFARKLGPLHRTTLSVRYAYTRTLWWRSGPAAFVAEIRKIVQECQTQLRAADARTVTFRLHLARWLLNPETASSAQQRSEGMQILAEERARLAPAALDADAIVQFVATHGSAFVSEYKLCASDETDLHDTKPCHCTGSLSYLDHACDAEELFWPKLYLWDRRQGSGEDGYTGVLQHIHKRPSLVL